MSTAFNPRCALQVKAHDDDYVHRIYDSAKTPLQRLLLSGVLSDEEQQALREAIQTLDPLRLLDHLEGLQHALCCGVERTVVLQKIRRNKTAQYFIVQFRQPLQTAWQPRQPDLVYPLFSCLALVLCASSS
jgi:hypothetical protein